MLTAANKTCHRLWKDDSGVVLAFTVVVFLTLFLMAVSVYAVGENIRQRIALQNAADAAAYSGAVVEADALSRLAILNQAMSWDYAQLCKLQQDYIIGKWAYSITTPDAPYTSPYYLSTLPAFLAGISACRYLHVFQLWIGATPGDGDLGFFTPPWPDTVRHRGRIATWGDWHPSGAPFYQIPWSGPVDEIYKAAEWFNDNKSDLQSRMDTKRQEVNNLANYEDWIQKNLRTRIREAVQYVLQANLVGDAENDLSWSLSLASGGNNTADDSDLEPMLTTEKDQDKFFTLGGIEDYGQNMGAINYTWYFGPGWKTWYNLQTAGDVTQGHKYQSGRLFASWYAGYYDHEHTDIVTPWGEIYFCHFWNCGRAVNPRVVIPSPYWPADIAGYRDNYFLSGCSPRARILTANYFQRSGAVSVGVSRTMRNPFASYLDLSADSGMFGAFDVGNRKSWAVAIARAGYKNGGDGDYDPHGLPTTMEWVDNREKDKGNLSIRDWDAVLIPIRRAWVMNTGGGWEGDSTVEVMNAFAAGNSDAKWQRLFSDIPAESPRQYSTSLGWSIPPDGTMITWDSSADGGSADSPQAQMERAVWH